MSSSNLSINYRFYDSTLPFVNENITTFMKNFFALRSKCLITQSLDDQNLKGKIVEMIGLSNSKLIREKKLVEPFLKR